MGSYLGGPEDGGVTVSLLLNKQAQSSKATNCVEQIWGLTFLGDTYLCSYVIKYHLYVITPFGASDRK